MNEDIGERLTRLRKREQMTQKDLAAALDVSPSTIGMYEQGRRIPKNQHLIKLSEVLNVSVDYILRGDSEQPGKDENYALIVESVSNQLKMAEPAIKLAGQNSRLLDLEKNDIEFLCKAILSAKADLERSRGK